MNPVISLIVLAFFTPVAVVIGAIIWERLAQLAPINYCETCGKAALHSEWLPCKFNTSTGKPEVVERLVWCMQDRKPTPPSVELLPLPMMSKHVGHDWKDIHSWQYSHWNAIERKRA